MVLATPALTAPWGLDALLTLVQAGRAADARGAAAISSEQLLLSLLATSDGAIRRLLRELFVDVHELSAKMVEAVRLPVVPEEPGRFDHGAKLVLGSAAAEARAMGADRIEDVHLLLGLLCGPSGPGRVALEDAGASLLRVRLAARDLTLDPDEAPRRLSESGLSLDVVRTDAARLMGDASAKSKLVVIQDASSGSANRVRRAVRRRQVSTWPTARKSARFGDLVAATRPSAMFWAMVGVLAASTGLLIWEPSPSYDRLFIAVFIIAGWMISLCVHEYGHAAAAFLGGDRGTLDSGYLTLDVRRYANPILTIGLPLLGLITGRLPLPGGAVLINERALRSRRWELAVSAAGPLGTLACLVLSAIPFLIGGEWVFYDSHPALWLALGGLVAVQASALILNLLPIPPLDGFHILSHWLSPEAKAQGLMLNWLPLMVLFFVLRQPGPVGDQFWGTVHGLEQALRMPVGLGEYALSFISRR